MTTNAARAATLVRALRARVDGDADTAADLYTEDVTAWTPRFATTSRKELLAEFEDHDGPYTDVVLDVRPLEVGGDYACAEWTVAMTYAGKRVTGNGITVAEFRGEQICSLRQYWDELGVLEQLGLIATDSSTE